VTIQNDGASQRRKQGAAKLSSGVEPYSKSKVAPKVGTHLYWGRRGVLRKEGKGKIQISKHRTSSLKEGGTILRQ